MTGDLHDHAFPDSPKWYARRTMESGHVMQAALCWLGIYYLIVKPFRLLGCDNPDALSHYNNTGLRPRFSRIFSTWREYENCQWVTIFPTEPLFQNPVGLRRSWSILKYTNDFYFFIIFLLPVFFSGWGKIVPGTVWFLACGLYLFCQHCWSLVISFCRRCSQR